MRTRKIIKFENEVKEKLNLDVEIDNSNNNYYNCCLITDLERYNKESHLEYSSTKRQLFSFTLINHPNCGMEIIQNIYLYPSDSKYPIKMNVLKNIFIGLLRAIYPLTSHRHVFFTFQNEGLNSYLKELDFLKVYNYVNYNHSTSANRAIWMLNIKDFKGIGEGLEEEKKVEVKVKRPVGRPRKNTVPIALEVNMAT